MVVKNDGMEDVFNSTRTSLKRVEEVPIMNPAWSNPRTQDPFSGTKPPEKFDPMYSSGTKPYVVGSQDPSSKGENSYTVEFKDTMVVFGALPSVTKMGMGTEPDVKKSWRAIEEKVYEGPPSVALTSWNERVRPQ